MTVIVGEFCMIIKYVDKLQQRVYSALWPV